MRAIIICLIAIAVTGNVLTSTALAQGSNAAVRLVLPGGGADLICLSSDISVSVDGTDLLLRADALQNDLGCPAGASAPATAAAHAEHINLRGATNTRAVLRLDLPGGGSSDKCLLLGSAAASAADEATFMNLQALQADGGCPPPAVVTLNDFQITPTQLDITPGNSNCSIAGQPRRCLTLSWNTSVPPNVLTPLCSISQTAPVGQQVMQPASFDNPGSFVNPGNPGAFVSIRNNLLWPVNESAVSTGSKSFRMLCEPGGQSITRTVAFGDNRVVINSFNINQSSAAQGAQFNYSWNLSVIGNPVNPICTIRSLTSGVINTININPSSNPSGSASSNILSGAPLGAQTIRLECSPVSTQQDDSIEVTAPAAVQLQSFNIEQTTVQPGDSINFAWTLSLNGNPSNPSCTFSAVNAGVISAPVIIDDPATSGNRNVDLLAGAPQGVQSFTFSCSPGNSSLSDSLNVSSPRVIPVSFTPQLTVFPGQQLNFGWSAFLAGNPSSPKCQVSSTAADFIDGLNPQVFLLPNSPSSQTGSGSIQVLASASVGSKLLRFSCSPGNEPSIEVTVNVVDPPPASVQIDSFDVIETSSQLGGLLNVSFTVTLVNNPSAPGCRIDSETSGVKVSSDVIILPTTPVSQNGNGSATIIEVPPEPPLNATIRLRCFPIITSPAGGIAATDSILIESTDTPSVAIASFDIVETSITGDSFNVNWSVQVNGSPASPSCTLSSSVTGVIDDRVIMLNSSNGSQSGTLQVDLLAQAPTGIQLFEFSCNPGSSLRTDTLQIVPPDANPRVQINDFQLLQSSAVQGQSLGFSWSVTLIDNPQTISCVLEADGVINQVTLPVTTSPATQSGTGTVSILNNAPTGIQSFSLTCNPGATERFASALITAPDIPELFIDEFQLVQSSAAVGAFIDFSWQITLVNNPSNVDCRLSSPGTIDQVIIPVSAAAVQSGNGSVQILPTATPGDKTLNFACTASDADSAALTRQLSVVSGGSNPSVGIIDFNVIETDVLQGGSFNFNWSVVLTDIAGPGIASCTLSNPAVLAAPVLIALDPLNGLTQSGTSSASVRADASTGPQSLTFSCTPGSAVRNDTINVQQSTGDGNVIINSFNIVEAEAARGEQIQFDWNITLVDAPQDVSCTLSSDNASVINDVTLNLPSSPNVQSGSNTVNINTTAAIGAQGFRFTCLPGGDQLVDSVDITEVPEPRIDINSFNIIETGAAQGGTINFVWDVTLLNNPASPQCILSSNTAGVIDDQLITLAATPANQSGGDSVSINASATTGVQGFSFTCNPDGEFRTDNVTITAPGTLNLLFFDVRNASAARLSDVIFDFTVQRVNNPVNPACTLTAPDVITPLTIPVPTAGVTIQPLEGLIASILQTAPLGVADFTLTCTPGGQSAVEQVTITEIPPPGISINAFNIVQQTADPGDTLQFDYSVTRIGLPSAPECVLLAASQTSNEIIIPITTSGSATVTGSGDLFILPTAPPGARPFTFACRIDPGAPFEDAFGDTVTIQ